jgi:hypothetical protein
MTYAELLKRLQEMPAEKMDDNVVIYHTESDSYHTVAPFQETEQGEIPEFLEVGEMFIAL